MYSAQLHDSLALQSGTSGLFACLPPIAQPVSARPFPNPPSYVAVFREWHEAHSVCRFAQSSLPPRPRGTMWSTCEPGTGTGWRRNGSAQFGCPLRNASAIRAHSLP